VALSYTLTILETLSQEKAPHSAWRVGGSRRLRSTALRPVAMEDKRAVMFSEKRSKTGAGSV
jgi:hypothetical protein